MRVRISDYGHYSFGSAVKNKRCSRTTVHGSFTCLRFSTSHCSALSRSMTPASRKLRTVTASYACAGMRERSTNPFFEELPQRWGAVKNEVNDIGLAVSQVQEFAQRCQRFQEKILEAADCDVTDLLEKAQISLTPLQIVISGLAAASRKEGSKMGFLRPRPWKQKHPRIEQVQREVASIKSTLSVALQVANS